MSVALALTGLASVVALARGPRAAGERIPDPAARASIVPSVRAWSDSQEGRDPAVIFGQLCAVCHGEEGKGDGPVAGSMVPSPADLTDPERIGDLTDEELVDVLTNGKGTMPSFGAVLESGEIRAMVRHIRELSGTEGDPQDGDTP